MKKVLLFVVMVLLAGSVVSFVDTDAMTSSSVTIPNAARMDAIGRFCVHGTQPKILRGFAHPIRMTD
jgi:hypothetical protein